jgi:hypothetical protein
MTAVERHQFRRIAIAGNRRKDRLPDAALAPARETIVDRLVRPVFARTVLPTAANALHVHDAAQNLPIILSLGTGWLVGKYGSIFDHCSSVNQNRFGFIGWPPNRLTNPLNQHMVN